MSWFVKLWTSSGRAVVMALAKSKIRITRGHSSRQKPLVSDSATPEATAVQLRALAAKLESTSS